MQLQIQLNNIHKTYADQSKKHLELENGLSNNTEEKETDYHTDEEKKTRYFANTTTTTN